MLTNKVEKAISNGYYIVIEPHRGDIGNALGPGRILQSINQYINSGEAYLMARCCVQQRAEFIGGYKLSLVPSPGIVTPTDTDPVVLGRTLSLLECVYDGLEAAADAGKNGLHTHADSYRQTALQALEQLYKSEVK